MPQPLLGGVRPEAGELVEEGVGLFHAHLPQAFALVAELHACDARLRRPSRWIFQTSCIQSLRETVISLVLS